MNHGQIIDLLGGTAAVARRVSVRPASVSEWRSKGLPDGRLIELAAEIEDKGGPRRWDLRPDDWHRIWPELIGAEGAPAVPEATAQEAA
jgi:DNA-binding transcriptional regulator YdaS (Cro superfamily)